MDNGVGGSMSTANSAVSWRAVGGVSNQFPAGLRVLVVDDDPTCLKIMEKMLKNCLYEATTCSRAEIALSMLRESKTGFDVVISDVHMPDMDGFKLLEHIGLEMDLPVIMMSADDGKDVVMKGVTHGACDYLIKPVRIEALRNIWQHVVRKRRNELKESEQSGGADDSNRQQKPLEDADYASSANEGSWKSTKKRKDEEDDGEDRDDTSTLKKPRVVWSVELHQQFVQAVNQLGIDKAVPKKILELMNVPGLTRENVASHLQKYRLYLRRLSGVSQHQSGLNTPFIGSQEANFGSISSLSGLDLQAFSVSGQLLPQNLATLQAGGLGRSTATAGINMSLVDQRNLFSSEMPKLRFGAGQQLSNNNKQLNLLHGLPTTLEPKQLAHLHQSVQPFGNIGLQTSEGVSSFVNLPPSLRATSSAHGESVHGNQSSSLMMQLAEPRSRGQLLNEVSGGQASGLPSSIGQQLFSTEAVGRALGINGTLLNGRGAAYNPVSQAASGVTYNPVSQAASVVDFPINHITELPGNSFPLVTTAGVPTLASTGMYQGVGSLDVKGSRSFPPSYNIFNEFRQGRTQDWELQNVGLTFEASQHATSVQGNLDLSSPPSSHQDFASSQKNGQSRNISVVGKAMVSLREDNKHGNPETIAQYNSNLLVNNPVRVKAESVPNFSRETVLLGEHFSQDDLSALFKQQQEGSVESDFSFDGYTMDNIPV